MFCAYSKFGFAVRVIYAAAVFIKLVLNNSGYTESCRLGF